MDGLPFVTGAVWHWPRDGTVQMRVRERLRKNRSRAGSGGAMPSDGSQTDSAARKITSKIKQAQSAAELLDSKDAAAKILTRQMTQAKSATELLNILDGVVEGPTFNYFHASAAYRSLATWKRKGGLTPSDKASPVLPRLARRVQDMALKGQLEPRAVGGPDPRQGQWHEPTRPLQKFVGCGAIKGHRTRGEGNSASHRGPDPKQGKCHATTRTLQQFVGGNPPAR